MASVFRHRDKWRAQVMVEGTRVGKLFETRREAAQWAADKERETLQPEVSVGAQPLSVALKKYADSVSVTKAGERWERVRLDCLAKDQLAAIPCAQVSAPHIAAWRDRRLQEVAPSSVNRELNLLSSVFEKMRKEWHWCSVNPVRDVDRPKNPRPRDRRISADEIDRILITLGYDEAQPIVTAQQEIGLSFLLSLETAMRLGEVMALERRHLYLRERYLHVEKSKNGDSRDVPLTTRAIELLERVANRKGLLLRCGAMQASVLFGRAVKRAGIKDLTYHDSRHEAITRLARRLDVLDLARMIGHRDLKSLQIYYNATASEIAARLG